MKANEHLRKKGPESSKQIEKTVYNYKHQKTVIFLIGDRPSGEEVLAVLAAGAVGAAAARRPRPGKRRRRACRGGSLRRAACVLDARRGVDAGAHAPGPPCPR